MAKNKALILLFLFLSSCSYHDSGKLFEDNSDSYTKFIGNFNYTHSQNHIAMNKIGVEFKKPFYTLKDKSKMFYVGGKAYHNYDMFGVTYHINTFTHLGIEF